MSETRISDAPWQDSPRVALRVRAGRVVAGPRGGWAIDDWPGVPDAYMELDATGAPQVNDAAVSGARVRVLYPHRIIATD